MSFYGDENILFQLQGTLLSACHERKNQRSNEIFGTKDDIYTSDYCNKACNWNEKREETMIGIGYPISDINLLTRFREAGDNLLKAKEERCI